MALGSPPEDGVVEEDPDAFWRATELTFDEFQGHRSHLKALEAENDALRSMLVDRHGRSTLLRSPEERLRSMYSAEGAPSRTS